MMQLLCNGVYLDLYDNFSLQITHTNPLFAFDKMECERTTQFKLPSTPKNDRVFGLSRIPAYSGVGMMNKYAAQLQAGVVVKDGFLYVKECTDGDYQAVYVFGDLLGLKAIKDAGKIGDYYTPVNTAQYGIPATFPGSTIFQTLKYANSLILDGGIGRYTINEGALRPCINLYILLVQGLQQTFNFNMPSVPSALQDIVYIPKEYKDASGNVLDDMGDTIQLRYNLPEWTGVELIKTIANLGGYLPNFERNTLTFVSGIAELAAPVDITGRLMSIKTIERTLDGFSRNNLVRWADDDKFPVSGYAENYIIQNDNISAERDLYTLPAQPAQYVSTVQPTLADVGLVWDEYATSYLGTIRNPLGERFIARWRIGSGSDEDTLKAYSITSVPPKNPIIQTLCSVATSIKVEARMTYQEYTDITNLSQVLVHNGVYVWMERQWQKDVAQFTLAKIA